MKVVALSGGVGGAKLALGLSKVLSPEELLIVANTGDDFEHLGLHISPDVDTVMYTLAGLANPETGWGLQGETWNFLAALERMGSESWFRLGDRDLATHVERTRRLREGLPLSRVTRELCRSLGVRHPVIPMSDDRVRTIVHTEEGALEFQHYFVREQCRPAVSGFAFEGINEAEPAPELLRALSASHPVLICPSNPFVSVDPMLELPGVADTVRAASSPVIAVSPIVGGRALKGPAAKMFEELDMPASALEVARHYAERNLLDGFVLDELDESMAPEVEALGLRVRVTDTVMMDLADRVRLAAETLELAADVQQARDPA